MTMRGMLTLSALKSNWIMTPLSWIARFDWTSNADIVWQSFISHSCKYQNGHIGWSWWPWGKIYKVPCLNELEKNILLSIFHSIPWSLPNICHVTNFLSFEILILFLQFIVNSPAFELIIPHNKMCHCAPFIFILVLPSFLLL